MALPIKKSELKFGTVILSCSCSHDYQTKKYGKKMRIHNLCGGNQARCTVCSNKRSVG